MRLIGIVIVTAIFSAGTVSAGELACIPRAEMGETTAGQHLYERDADLQIRNLSRFDFEALTLISAEGKRSGIKRVERNVYKTTGSGAPYYFVTNDDRSIVTEVSVRNSAAYVKVLLCK